MNIFLKKNFHDSHCSHKPEPFPKSNLRCARLFSLYNYNHFVNIILKIILPRTISKYC